VESALPSGKEVIHEGKDHRTRRESKPVSARSVQILYGVPSKKVFQFPIDMEEGGLCHVAARSIKRRPIAAEGEKRQSARKEKVTGTCPSYNKKKKGALQ